MPRRRRTLLLVTLALAVPLPAFALPGEVDTDAEPAVADLGVSASLDSCGVLETQIVCQISVSYATLPNATSYTASITSADGSVVDFGAVPAGGTTLTVPYAGNGTYGVRVTAYGIPEESDDGEEEVIATDVSGSDSISEAPGESRITDGPVKSEAGTRQAPEAEKPSEPAPVESEPTCVPEQPAPAAEPAPETTTPELETTATPEADPNAQPESGAAVGRQSTEAQAGDPAQATTPPATTPAPETGDCPAP